MVLTFQIVGTIAQWQVYAATHDSLYIGFLALTEVIPAILMNLVGGYAADSFNRRSMALIGSFFASASVIILVSTSGSHTLTSIVPLFIATAINGIGRGIMAPASTALLGEIVNERYYARAAVFNSIAWQTSVIAGPALAGIIYEKISPLLCYQIALGLSTVSTLFYFSIHPPKKPRVVREPFSVAMREGFHFLWNTKIILGSISLDMFAVLFGGAVALLPAFSDQIYLMGASGLGLLRSSPAIGAAIMGILLIFLPIRRGAGKILLLSVTLFGISMIAFGLNTSFYAALGILVFSGAVDNVSVVMRSTILQTHTTDKIRGRIAAINSIFIASSNEIGAFESGLTARYMGLVPSVVFGGCMTVLVVLFIAWRIPSLRRLSFAGVQK
ncbi:MAG: hypothetical protein LDLANPLL_02470 [Turneriella sp.]|nr:hypothetical protein [Turneriella sp.]